MTFICGFFLRIQLNWISMQCSRNCETLTLPCGNLSIQLSGKQQMGNEKSAHIALSDMLVLYIMHKDQRDTHLPVQPVLH